MDENSERFLSELQKFDNLDTARKLVSSVNPVYRVAWGATLFHHVCLLGDGSLVQTLIDAEAEVNADYKGVTPLHWACMGNKVDVVGVLLKHPSVDVFAKTPDGYTALMIAKRNGCTAIEKLLEQKISENPGTVLRNASAPTLGND